MFRRIKAFEQIEIFFCSLRVERAEVNSMGQFSWLDCVNHEQIVDGANKIVYLLVPREFGGGRITESCYGGYGIFGGRDVYDLIAEWNKPMIPEIIRKAKSGNWVCNISEGEIKIMENFYNDLPLDTDYPKDAPRFFMEKRGVGILMACYDEDNARLDYPIKVTYNPCAVYELCPPSPGDPNQGWPPEEEDYEDDSVMEEIC